MDKEGAADGKAGVLVKSNDKKGLLYHLIRDRDLYVMVFPGIILIFIFHYIPIYGVIIAFRDYDIVSGFFNGKWVGIKYFLQFFQDPYCFRLIKNTVLLSLYGILWGFPAPIIFALLLNEVRNRIFKKTAQSLSYLPYFISTVIIVGMMMKLFSSTGIVNSVLSVFGVEPQMFFADPKWFRTLYIGSGIWQGLGYSSIIYLAALSNINIELYESAIIDGANRWHQVYYITIPSIMPMVRILLILSFGGLMRVGFDKVYLMYNPGTYETSDVIATYVYRRGIQGMDFSFATAVGLFNSIISFIFLTTANYISKKTSEDSLW